MTRATVEVHTTKFFRNTVTGLCKAQCTCGWVAWGKLDELQSRAAVHPDEWQVIEAANAPAVAA